MNHTEISHPLSEREIYRGLRTNIIAGSLGMAFFAVATGVPITMLMERLGATGEQIGLIVTCQQVAMVAQIPAALLAEHLRSRKIAFASLALGHRVLWFVPALLPLLFPEGAATTIRVIIAVVAVSSLMAQASAPLWYSWVSDLVPDDRSGRFWGTRQSTVTFSFLIMTALAGWLLDRFTGPAHALTGFSVVFGAGAMLGVADILVHLWVPEPLQKATGENSPLRRLMELLRDADFRRLTLIMGAWTFSLGLIGSFGIVYLKRAFDASYLQLSVLSVIASLGTVIASTVLGLAIDRIGARPFGAFLLFVCPLMGAVWWLVSPHTVEIPLAGHVWRVPQPILVIGGANLLAGALYSSVGLCHMKLLGAVTSRHHGRTLAMAVHWTFIGLVGSLGPWAGGKFMDMYTSIDPGWRLPLGPSWSFFHWLLLFHALICWFVAAPLMLGLRRGVKEPSFGAVLARLRPGNPLRAAGMLYDMWLAVTTNSSDTRARAIRRLGEKRATVAVSDLIRKLDDPSAEVREEAAMALGRIGGDEAIAALIEELRDPQSDVALPVARALRRARDPRSVDALMGALETGDRETAVESARALGAIGDPRAAEALRDTLRSTRDLVLATASGEALARLGMIDAIYDILPRIKTASNPVLRRALCVAVGDLLGEPGEFYSILAREEETHGIEVERLLRQIRRWMERSDSGLDLATVERLKQGTHAIQNAFDEEQIPLCADRMVAWAREFTEAIPWPPPRKNRSSPSVKNDPAARVAAMLWFLDLLNRHWVDVELGHRDRTDLLLGIYALYALVQTYMGT